MWNYANDQFLFSRFLELFYSSTFALTYVKRQKIGPAKKLKCSIFLLAFFKLSPHFASLQVLNLNPETHLQLFENSYFQEIFPETRNGISHRYVI